jgi:hypothetical protein
LQLFQRAFVFDCELEKNRRVVNFAAEAFGFGDRAFQATASL